MSAAGNNLEVLARMEIFAAVVREGGFSKAALALGLSKSNVSKQISALEEHLGVRLLARTTRLVRPTDAGALFFERCLEVSRLATEAGAELSAMQDEPVGRLRISVPLSFGREFLEEPLLEYVARFPRVEASIDVSDRPVQLVREGFDVAIRVGRVADPDLVVRRLAETRRVVVASPGYLERAGTPGDPSELSRHECLLYEYQSTPDRWLFSRGSRPFEVPVSGRFRSNNGDLLAAAAARGLGLALLPDFVVRPRIDSGELVAVLGEQCRDISVVNAVLPARKYTPAKVRELLQLFDAHLAPSRSPH